MPPIDQPSITVNYVPVSTTQLMPMSAIGDGLKTIILLPHGLGVKPTYFNAVAVAGSDGKIDSANISGLSADSNYIMVYYNIAPPPPPTPGVNNLFYNVSVKP